MDEANTFCAGTGPDGNRCICRRHVPKAKKDVDNPDICKNCNHIESAHPVASTPRLDISSYVKDLRDAGKVKAGPSSTSQLKATVSDAEAETSAGLRPKKWKVDSTSKTDTEPGLPASKKAKGKTRAVSTSGKPVQVQRLIFVPDGLYTVTDQTQNSKGNLNRTTLSPEYIDHLLEFCFAKLSQPSEPLVFHQGDSNAQICDIVKAHFRRPIEWLETHPYKPERNAGLDVQRQLWRLCIKTQRTIGLSYDPFPNGAKLHNRSLIIVSKQRIPEERYRDWDAPEPVTGSSDYELSTDDSESDDAPKKGKNGKYPLYSRFTLARLISGVLVAVKKEGGGSGLIRKVGGRSTRMSTGTIEWNHILDSDEDDLPATLLPMASAEALSTEGAAASSVAGSSSSMGAAPPVPSTSMASSSSPLFTSFTFPEPEPEVEDPFEDPFANDISTFFTTSGPNASPNNSRWAAAVAIAASTGLPASASSSTAALAGTAMGTSRKLEGIVELPGEGGLAQTQCCASAGDGFGDNMTTDPSHMARGHNRAAQRIGIGV
ncbi:hypothetical protein K438DRAFT_1790467 [Mycena galopus ATCC 62051]|nr:hypothetical protein K438DRAFT_1790467 [Mycena galopus ATCC 62051]